MKQLHTLTYAAISVPTRTQDTTGVGLMDTFDHPRLGAASHLIRLTTYDHHGDGSGPGPVAPSGWTEQVARYAASLIAPSKILIGIPAYSYDWSANGTTWLPDSQVAALGGAAAQAPSSTRHPTRFTSNTGTAAASCTRTGTECRRRRRSCRPGAAPG